MGSILEKVVLDDGQVISGPVENLNQFELISWANQLYRQNKKQEARAIMAYQHKRFMSTPVPPKAA